jgi:hypothetical protein
MYNGAPAPKRGDLLQTNVGNRRERTWFILRSTPVKPVKGVPRSKVWIERWWEIEPELRIKLWNSAMRNGGQDVIQFKRYPAKKKKQTFEQYMGDM